MSPYPVHYTVHEPARYSRAQLVVRIVALIVLGMIGLSLGTIFVIAYLALPAYAAARVAGTGNSEDYLQRDGSRLVRALRWFAAVYAWLALVVDQLPSRSPQDTVRIEVEPTGRPTAASALWRLLLGLPSALALAVLGFIGSFVWLWSAIRVLVQQRVGDVAHGYLTGLQRWTVRLLAYQACLVDEYPPFSFEDTPPHEHGDMAAGGTAR